MPDPLDPLHPQDKRGWLYGDPVAVENAHVARDPGIDYGTVESVNFIVGQVLVRDTRTGIIYPAPFACVHRITDADTGRYLCDLFQWGGQ